MTRFRFLLLIWGSLFLMWPIPVSGGQPSQSGPPDIPKPYIYKDRGLGTQHPRFTLNESGMLPDWFSLSLQHRTRYETLDRAFRSGTQGSDQALSLRTLVQATLRLSEKVQVHVEFQDSRVEFVDAGTPLSTAMVNSAELLEANLQVSGHGGIRPGDQWLVRGGRFTMDIGKRRLVARNRFRNTKNAFTGIDGIWESGEGIFIRGFLTLPIQREPSSIEALLDNEASFDKETLDRVFWGVFLSDSRLPWGDQGELYLFGLFESDDPDFPTRNRRLWTPGFRLFRPSSKGRWDYEWETIFQFGRSRTTASPADTRDLNHFAHFHHVEVGYTWQTQGAPRLVLAWDYGSGDRSPNDGSNQRFDPLFGATVFDFGPTGIHRAFIRSNIMGPGLQLIYRPAALLSTLIHYRALWLASDQDIWAGNSSLRDLSGNSGSFLGQQVFLRARWQAMANGIIEGGMVYRIDGHFQETAPHSPNQGNSIYSYLSLTLSF